MRLMCPLLARYPCGIGQQRQVLETNSAYVRAATGSVLQLCWRSSVAGCAPPEAPQLEGEPFLEAGHYPQQGGALTA